MMEDCYVCYSSLKIKDMISCPNPYCISFVCAPCFVDYLKFGIKERTLTFCTCGYIYFYKRFKQYLSEDDLEIFYNIILREATKSVNNLQDQILQEQNGLAQFRMERLYFYKKAPKAISFIINHSMSQKQHMISRDQKEQLRIKISDKLLPNKSRCSTVLCSGYLDNNGICNMCFNQFCLKCEKETTQDVEHVCNEEDKASIASLNILISCPKCHVKIIRSYGCNLMTCAVCNQQFNYTTGAVDKFIPHNENQPVQLINQKLTNMISSDNLYPLLKEFEESEPKHYQLKPTDLTQSPSCLANRYIRQHNVIRNVKRYFRTAQLIIDSFQRRTLTKHTLGLIINNLNE